MPGSIRINGEPVFQSGVYVEGQYTTSPAATAGEGVVAVILDLPVLEPVSQYLSTNKTALLNLIAKGDPTIKELANVGYNPTKNRLEGPAGIVLISPTPSTAAYGYFIDGVGAVAVAITSQIFGTRGNRTVLTYTENTDTGGGDVTITNLGADTETIRVPSEKDVLILDYTYPAPLSLVADTAYGFGDTGYGSGVVRAEQADGELAITFTRTLTDDVVTVAAHVSWYPDGPIQGTLTATVLAGAAWDSATNMRVAITGRDQYGVPQTETLVLTPDNIDGKTYTGNVAATSTTVWSFVSDVKCFPFNVGRVFTGSMTIAGHNFLIDDSSVTVDAAINTINEGKGFTASTASGRALEIKVSELDNLAPTTLDAALSAQMWSLIKAVNDSSILVTLSAADSNGYRVIPFAQTVTLANGTVGTATNDDWQSALDEARYANVTDIVIFSTVSGLHQKLARHVTDCWGKYQNERIGHYAVEGNLGYTALKTQAALINSPNLRRWLDTPSFVQTNGTTLAVAPYWLAFASACASNGDRRRTQNAWQPNIVTYTRNAALRTPEMTDELIKLGYNVLVQPNGRPAKLARELTCWTQDNDAFKSESGSPRSQVEVQRGLRAVAEAQVESALNIEAAVIALPGALNNYLDAQRTAQRIVDYDASATAVDDSDPLVLEVIVRYQPRGSKAFVKITAQVARIRGA